MNENSSVLADKERVSSSGQKRPIDVSKDAYSIDMAKRPLNMP
jgi:hypothetical protein